MIQSDAENISSIFFNTCSYRLRSALAFRCFLKSRIKYIELGGAIAGAPLNAREEQERWADVSHSISCHSWIVCSCLWRPTGVAFSVLVPLFLFPRCLIPLPCTGGKRGTARESFPSKIIYTRSPTVAGGGSDRATFQLAS